MLGQNKESLNKEKNIFIKSIPNDVSEEEVHNIFKEFGEILSVKVSKNEDHSSRGYGFVCFASPDDSKKALDAKSSSSTYNAVKFQPKDLSQVQKNLANNIYVKNYPKEWTEADLRDIFSKYGHIKSLIVKQIPKDGEDLSFAFVCFEDPKDAKNFSYGPDAAEKAIEALHEKPLTHKGHEAKMYVRAALPKPKREAEKKKEFLKFKASKKRCNLYVRNFPDNWTEENLVEVFSKYGDIESKKLITRENGGNYAFVCFKQPDHAIEAKNALTKQPFDGKSLQITNYEIREFRELQIMSAKEKTDFDRFVNEHTKSQMGLKDFSSDPKMTQLLQYVVGILQSQQQLNPMG